MHAFSKQPAEQYTIAVEFSGKLPTGASLASGAVSAVDEDENNASSTVLGSTSATIAGTQAKVLVKAGTDGKTYKVTFLMTLSNGDKLEEDLQMRVVAI